MKTLIATLAITALSGCASMTPEQKDAMRAVGQSLHQQSATRTGFFTPIQPIQPIPYVNTTRQQPTTQRVQVCPVWGPGGCTSYDVSK